MADPKRGDIYKIEVLRHETVGTEYFGYHWYVIISIPAVLDLFALVMAVPLTSPEYDDGIPKDSPSYRKFRIRIFEASRRVEAGEHGLKGDSVALLHQVRPLSIDRFHKVPRGSVNSFV